MCSVRSLSPPLIMSQSHGRRKHESLLPPKDSPIYNPLKDLSVSKTKHPSMSKGNKQRFIILEEGPPRPQKSPAFPSPKTLLSRTVQAEALGCIYVPTSSTKNATNLFPRISTELKVWHGLDCSEQCLPMPGHQVYTNEHLEDFIDVFKRRLQKQRRALRPWDYEQSEREYLLEELKGLGEEQNRILQEMDRVNERKTNLKRKKAEMRRRRRRSVAKQQAVKAEWERRTRARQR